MDNGRVFGFGSGVWTTTSYGSTTGVNETDTKNHSLSLTGLSSDTLYHYRVKSKDASNNEEVSADSTFTTTAPTQEQEDKTPPSCSVSKLSSTDKTEATQIKVTWTGQDNKTSESSLTFDVQVKDVLDGNWLDFSTGQKGVREAFYPPSTNPLSLKLDNGHKYLFRCRAKDEAGNQACYPDDASCSPKVTDTEDKLKAVITVARSEEGKSNETVEKQLWGIVSFPYEPDTDKASVSAALSALIPDINKDYTQAASQLLIWDPALVDNSECATCNRYQHASKIVVGKGYFLWPSESVGSVLIRITGKPKNQGTTQEVTLSVNAKDAGGSWNMLGSPYLFNVDWKDIMVRVEGETDRTLQQAIDAGIIKSTIYTYGKKSDGTLGYTSQTAPDGALKPWKGYFVKAMKTLTLLFQPKQCAHNVMDAADEGVFAKTLSSANGGFVMEMSAKASLFSDSDNYFGVLSDASDDEDKYDIEDPPRVSPSVSLSFHGKNIKYAYDVKAKGIGASAGKTWTFAVETDVKDSNVELKWKPVTGAAAEKMALLDVTSNTLVDMAQNSSYQFPSGNGGKRLFKIFYGKELVEKEQEKRTGPVNLLEAYTAPNPYRGAGVSSIDAKGKFVVTSGVTFKYKLSGQVMRVHIEVYTITGKLVDKFEGELDGETIWPFGNQLSNGVYIYRITAYDAQGNQAKKVNKLVVIK